MPQLTVVSAAPIPLPDAPEMWSVAVAWGDGPVFDAMIVTPEIGRGFKEWLGQVDQTPRPVAAE